MFDDFLNMANDILDNNESLKAQFQKKYKFILSDEFQDISMSQSLLLKKLNFYKYNDCRRSTSGYLFIPRW